VEGATETTNSGATDRGTLSEDGARLEGDSAKESAKEKETQGSIETATQTGNEAETTPETAPETSPAVAAVVAIENADASAASEVVLAKTDNRTIENADTDPAVTETAAVAVTEVVAESVVETGTETATESAAETEAEAAPDMEVFFTFTWGRNRAQSKPKGQGRRFSDGPAKEVASNTGDTAKKRWSGRIQQPQKQT
jgi:ATP-dependent RNA helicase SUPV3L1/SUV3